ncbi:DNA polymerase III subunit gamma/tau [Comamonas sp.]
MSYLVLARKYRPRNFAEMVGQEHVVQALGNALTQQRLHHAYLFTGTRGVGKTTVSRIFAKSVNCTGPDGQGGITATPCGVCPACTEIDSGRFPDYIELDAASNRGVDEVQSLLEQAVYKPVQGRFKVFMIDEVHMLTNTAFNAMLKTLEEPPEYLKFVLATTDPQKVPVTVLSRCLQFNLRPMAPETVFEHLTQVLAKENIPAEPQALKLLARGARGSMRDALSLTDQAIAFGCGQLQEEAVRQMLGSVDRSYVFRLIAALAQGDGRSVVETVDALRHNGISAASTLEEMSSVLQRMAVLQAVPDMAAAVDGTDPDAVQMLELAQAMPADETQLLYSICLHGRQELGLAPDEYAALTMALLRLLAFKPQGPSAQAASAEKKTLKLPELPAAVAPQPQPQPVLQAAAAPAPLPEPAMRAPVAEVVDAPATVAAVSTQEAPPPWEDIPPEAMQAPQESGGNEPPVWDDVPMDAAPLDVMAEPQPLQSAAPSARDALQETALGEVWYALITQLDEAQAITALVRELAMQSQLVAQEGGRWSLRVQRTSLNQAMPRERLLKALSQVSECTSLQVDNGPVSDTPALRNKARAEAQQKQAEAIVLSDPQVQHLMQNLGATIVPGSIRPV